MNQKEKCYIELIIWETRMWAKKKGAFSIGNHGYGMQKEKNAMSFQNVNRCISWIYFSKQNQKENKHGEVKIIPNQGLNMYNYVKQ